jgi:gliding motility-associated-like protein
MENGDKIKDLFSEKLVNHEAQVRPELWKAVSAKVAATTAAGSTATVSVFSKILMIGFSAAALVTGIYLLSGEEEKEMNEVATNKPVLINNKEEISPVSDQEVITEEREIIKKNQEPEQTNFVDIVPVDTFTIKPNYTPLKERKAEVKQEVKTENKENLNKEVIPNVTDEANHDTSSKENKNVNITLPNVFSPNGDGQHDEFFIDLSSLALTDFNLIIMNRSNKVVYTTKDVDFRWAGLDMSGQIVEAGTYIYYFTGTTEKGTPVSKYSTLEVLK